MQTEYLSVIIMFSIPDTKRSKGFAATVMLVAVAALCMVSAGCTTASQPITPTAAPTEVPVITPAPTADAGYAVTQPIVVKADDSLITTKTTIDAVESGNSGLVVTVTYDKKNSMGATGDGLFTLAYIFAYNYNDVPKDFNPQTREDLFNAGVPYKSVRSTIYPNNVVYATCELPVDSVPTTHSLSIGKPYNYGVIVYNVNNLD